MKKQNKSSAPNMEQLNKWKDYQKKHMVFFDKNMMYIALVFRRLCDTSPGYIVCLCQINELTLWC